MYQVTGFKPFAAHAALVAICVLSGSGHPAFASDKLAYAPPETWIKPVALPKPDARYSGAPGQWLLQNSQLKFFDDGSTTYYNEFAIHIQTPAGLPAAQAFVVWNPDTDEATVNKLQIIRGDQVIDVLAKGQTFTVLRREQNLDRAMLDGYLTGVLQPEGMQVGDTMVFASSIKRRDPVLGGNVEAVLPGLSGTPVVQQFVRATWQPAQDVRWRQSNDLHGKFTKTSDAATFLMERTRVVPNEVKYDIPARFNQFGLIEFSQFASWQEMSKVLAPSYEKATVLSVDSSLQNELAKIKTASSDSKVRAAMALQLVENQVRYVFLGMNLGGYIPAQAETTWQRRFGDCKGKTALLIALLNALGIKAEPALVSTGGGDGLDQRLPSFELFDHVIVRAEIDGAVYWMDGTRFGDKTLDSLPTPPLHWALPIRAEGASLEALPARPLLKPTSDSVLRLDASAGLDISAPAHAEVVLRGDEATQFDMAFTALAAGDRDKGLRGYWGSKYDWIEPRKVSAVFDSATGEERITMDGAAKMEWLASEDGATWRYQTDIMSIGWSYPIAREPGARRELPVVINFPYFERTREEIVLPKHGDGFTTEGNAFDKTAGGSEFKRTVVLKDGVLMLESSKRSLVPEISYSDAMAVTDDLTKLWKEDVFLVAPKRYRKNTAAKANVESASTTAEKSVDELVAEGKELSSQYKLDEALSAYNKVLRIDEKNVAALQGRGAILIMKGNYSGAAADLELANKIDPTQWMTLNGLGTARMSQNRTDDAIAAYTAALDIYPNDMFALLYRARAYITQGKTDLARQDAQAVNDLDADSLDAVQLLADIAIANKHPDEAKFLIRQALVKNPDDVSLHSRMAQLLENCRGLDSEKCAEAKASAVTEYDAVIALKPSAYAYAMRAQDRPKADRVKKLEDIDAGIKADPKSNLPLLVRAAILINEDKDYEKSLQDLNAAIELDPKDSQPYSIRSGVYFSSGKPELAVADLDAVKRMQPQQGWAYNAACWGRATHDIELDVALADCDTAVKLTPKEAAFLDSRGFVKLRLNRLEDALSDYNAALTLRSDLAASLYGRGLVKLREGDKAGGKADLVSARKIYDKIDEQFASYGLKP